MICSGKVAKTRTLSETCDYLECVLGNATVFANP